MNYDPIHSSNGFIRQPSSFTSLPQARFVFNVSQSAPPLLHSNTNLAKSFATYDPYIDALTSRNVSIMLVITHQTFGEGRGYDWDNMTTTRWMEWILRLSEVCSEIALHYKGRIQYYQIGNEYDQKSVASIAVVPSIYRFMLEKVGRAIRDQDPKAKLVSAGMVSGAITGSDYLRLAGVGDKQANLVDAVAFHPYGQGGVNGFGAQFGLLKDFLKKDNRFDKPLFLTEWGILDSPSTPQEIVALYAKEFLRVAREGGVVQQYWYAWGVGMHNGYGLQRPDRSLNQVLFDELKKWGKEVTIPEPEPIIELGAPINVRLVSASNLRNLPGVAGTTVLRTIPVTEEIQVYPDSIRFVSADQFYWYGVKDAAGLSGWVAKRTNVMWVVIAPPPPPPPAPNPNRYKNALKAVRSDLQVLIGNLDAVLDVTDQSSVDVPYVSQLDPNSTLPNDCGQATILMRLKHAGKAPVGLTVDQLSRLEPGLTSARELVNLAWRYGVSLSEVKDPSIDDLINVFNQGSLPILLVSYSDLGIPVHHGISSVNQGPHWIIMVGYEKDNTDPRIKFHDPLWQDEEGANLWISGPQFKKAFMGWAVI